MSATGLAPAGSGVSDSLRIPGLPSDWGAPIGSSGAGREAPSLPGGHPHSSGAPPRAFQGAAG